MWFYCCDHLPPSLFTVTTDLNVESSRTFGGGKKRATFNTDLSPFESAQRYFVPNGRSMLSSLGKKWSWVRLLWRLWDHHRAVNEPRWRKRLDQEGGGGGGQVDKERPKVIKEKQRQMTTTNEPQWRKTVDQRAGWLSKPQLRVEKDLQFWTEAVFWEEIWFFKYFVSWKICTQIS